MWGAWDCLRLGSMLAGVVLYSKDVNRGLSDWQKVFVPVPVPVVVVVLEAETEAEDSRSFVPGC